MKPSHEYSFEQRRHWSVQRASLSRSKYPDVWCVWPLYEVGELRTVGGLSPCHYPKSDPSVVTSSRVWHHGQHIMCHVTGHSHPSQQTQSPIQPTSECRQQYLNLWSTLPKIPSKILGFQIRNILKNCISWGLENIYLSTELLKARDWISTKLLLLPLYEWINDSCSPSLLACVTIHCLMGNGHEKCSKISIVQFWWPKAKCSFAVCEVIITTDQV